MSEEHPPSRPDVYRADCPTRAVLDRVADKWTTLVTGVLAGGAHRYGELARAIPGVSPRVLSRTLRDLERDGLVHREVVTAIPPAVVYSLTPLGRTLDEVVDPLRAWAERHVGAIHAARADFDAAAGDVDRTPWQRRRPAPRAAAPAVSTRR